MNWCITIEVHSSLGTQNCIVKSDSYTFVNLITPSLLEEVKKYILSFSSPTVPSCSLNADGVPCLTENFEIGDWVWKAFTLSVVTSSQSANHRDPALVAQNPLEVASLKWKAVMGESRRRV